MFWLYFPSTTSSIPGPPEVSLHHVPTQPACPSHSGFTRSVLDSGTGSPGWVDGRSNMVILGFHQGCNLKPMCSDTLTAAYIYVTSSKPTQGPWGNYPIGITPPALPQCWPPSPQGPLLLLFPLALFTSHQGVTSQPASALQSLLLQKS